MKVDNTLRLESLKLQWTFLFQMRVAFYLRMVAMEDVEIQRRGFVFILSAADIEGGLDLDLPKVRRSIDKQIAMHG